MHILLLALAIACLSQPANLVRGAHAPIEFIGFWRLLIAAGVLAPAAWSARGSWRAASARARVLVAAAGVVFFVHLWTFFYSATHTRIANCMVAFSIHPLFTAAGAWMIFGERPTRRLLAAYILAVVGIGCLVSGSAALVESGLRGDFVGVVSAAAFSGYVLLGKRVRREIDNRAYAVGIYSLAAACFFACGYWRGVLWTGYPSTTWAAILALALIVTLGGHAVFSYLLGSMDVNVMSCAKLLEPALAAFGAYLIYGEALKASTIWAFSFIAAAVLVLLWPISLGRSLWKICGRAGRGS